MIEVNFKNAERLSCIAILSVVFSVLGPGTIFAMRQDLSPYQLGMSTAEIIRLKGPALVSEKHKTDAEHKVTLRYADATFYFEDNQLIYWSKSSGITHSARAESNIEHQKQVSNLLRELMQDRS